MVKTALDYLLGARGRFVGIDLKHVIQDDGAERSFRRFAMNRLYIVQRFEQ
jgi:hypothetical protein